MEVKFAQRTENDFTPDCLHMGWGGARRPVTVSEGENVYMDTQTVIPMPSGDRKACERRDFPKITSESKTQSRAS